MKKRKPNNPQARLARNCRALANTSDIALDEARAYELFERFGSWANVEQSRGAA